MTAPLLNQARIITALVLGDSKRAMLKQIKRDALAPEAAPIQMIRNVRFYLDAAAAPD